MAPRAGPADTLRYCTLVPQSSWASGPWTPSRAGLQDDRAAVWLAPRRSVLQPKQGLPYDASFPNVASNHRPHQLSLSSAPGPTDRTVLQAKLRACRSSYGQTVTAANYRQAQQSWDLQSACGNAVPFSTNPLRSHTTYTQPFGSFTDVCAPSGESGLQQTDGNGTRRPGAQDGAADEKRPRHKRTHRPRSATAPTRRASAEDFRSVAPILPQPRTMLTRQCL